MAFIDDIKRIYNQGSMLMRLIFINVAVFILLNLIVIVAILFAADGNALVDWVKLPGNLSLLIRRPWTLVTYMFVHTNLWHILFNMLWFYWLGRIFMEFFSPKQLAGLYILGGWGGAALFLLAANLLPYFSGAGHFLFGASASVMAIVVATAIYSPDYKIGLLFFGEVSIKWVAIVTVAISVLGLDAGNVGGDIAHIGGALVGAWYALRIKRGRDITRPLNAAIDFIVGLFNGRSFKWSSRTIKRDKVKRGGAQSSSRGRTTGGVSEEELDAILKKIKVSGYDALTREEREKLFRVSKDKTS